MPGKKRTPEGEVGYSDEYAPLKEELQTLAQRGRDDKDESSPGREIALAGFFMESRYGTIVRTDPDTGLPTATFTTTRPDRKGVDRTQRFLIGLACEVVTKDTVQQSEDIAGKKRVISEFEATKNAPQLFSQTVEKAQEAGDKVQRKIDEENYEFFAAVGPEVRPGSPVVRRVVTVSSGKRFDPVPVATFGRLMDIVDQVVDKELGAKKDKCEILCSHYAEVQSIALADGTAVDSVMPRLAIVVQVKTKSGRTTFGAIRGAGGGLEILEQAGGSADEAVLALAKRVAQDAIDGERAQSVAVLGSECPVILSSHAAGVLAHEVFGHPMEADIICENRRSKTAKLILKGRLGAQVSSHQALTIVDSGERAMDLGCGKVLDYAWGTIAHDERGQPPTRTVLVKNGVMVNVLSDERTINEVLDGLKPEVAAGIVEHGLSGNVRRERFDCPALVRMTNTFVLADPEGPKTLADLANKIPKNKRGVYVKTCAGGWVQPDTGDFCIKGALGFLIENGIITDKPVRDVDITGNIAKFGDQIEAIGSAETVTERFTGYCGKNGQWVPVEGAAPALYIRDVRIGTTGGYRFDETLAEYLKQLAEVRSHQRDQVYVPAIEEVSGIARQDGLCFVTQALPVQDEFRLIQGLDKRAEFVRDENERMVKRCATL